MAVTSCVCEQCWVNWDLVWNGNQVNEGVLVSEQDGCIALTSVGLSLDLNSLIIMWYDDMIIGCVNDYDVCMQFTVKQYNPDQWQYLASIYHVP